jgi:hypothetical protein
MKTLTDEEEMALREAGWKKDFGMGRNCRICHSAALRAWGWSSPKYSFYHEHCVGESGIAQKAIREHA